MQTKIHSLDNASGILTVVGNYANKQMNTGGTESQNTFCSQNKFTAIKLHSSLSDSKKGSYPKKSHSYGCWVHKLCSNYWWYKITCWGNLAFSDTDRDSKEQENHMYTCPLFYFILFVMWNSPFLSSSIRHEGS